MNRSPSPLRLDEDRHVHSTFSDGASTVAENIAAAEACGLRVLGCVDHVRVDTTYVPDYVRAVREARATTDVQLTIGIEAKLLDASGALDLPGGLDGVDFIYIADHQFPGREGTVSPRVLRADLERGARSVAEVLEQLTQATAAGIRRSRELGFAPVVAHLFSILPKIGLDEAEVTAGMIDAIVTAAAEADGMIEVSERWKCPGPRVIRAAIAAGVSVVASTDSHRAKAIADYTYVARMAAAVSSATVNAG